MPATSQARRKHRRRFDASIGVPATVVNASRSGAHAHEVIRKSTAPDRSLRTPVRAAEAHTTLASGLVAGDHGADGAWIADELVEDANVDAGIGARR